MSNQGYQGDYQNTGFAPSNPFSSNQPGAPYQNQQQAGGFAPPSGPPPSASQPPNAGPRRAGTFQEADFVPASERGEQREAIEQFEMNRSGPENETDRDVGALQQEFPAVDGSLIAALYSDTKTLSATREMLREIAAQGQ